MPKRLSFPCRFGRVLSKSSTSQLFQKKNERKAQDVLLVAIHRDTIEKYQNIFRATKLNVKAFEIEIFSYVRSILSKELYPSLLVDLGAQATRFVIVDYGVIRMAHTLDRGSLELTDAISRSLGIEF